MDEEESRGFCPLIPISNGRNGTENVGPALEIFQGPHLNRSHVVRRPLPSGPSVTKEGLVAGPFVSCAPRTGGRRGEYPGALRLRRADV